MDYPGALVLWEAQFGDFANGAQVQIDQFIAPGEAKWLRMSGLVLLLPHGYEGQGPEHSSARIERYLQLCAEENMIVANCTTPANYFHILRRQLLRDFRKPLIMFTPKSLLRHKQCISKVEDFTDDTFHRVLLDDGETEHKKQFLNADSEIKKVIICSGKVYYDLIKARRDAGLEDKIAISTIEQISPFPFDIVKSECDKYENAELVFAQEEHKNHGAWSYCLPRFQTAVGGYDRRFHYVGRDVSTKQTVM